MDGPLFRKKYFVYILHCSDDTYYVGRTRNLVARLKRHREGDVKYTKSRRPVRLLCYTVFFREYAAVLFEKYLKSGSGRAFAKRHYR